MLLVADVGNTDTVFGVWVGDALAHLWRVDSAQRRTADELAALLTQLLVMSGHEFGLDEIDDVVVGSVVPSVTQMIGWMSEKYVGKPALIITAQTDLGIAVEVDNPVEVGPDRVINCLAASRHAKPPFVVIDFGTATTFDYVKKNGAYGGGIIVPGVHTALQALAAKAARLNTVEIKAPPRVIGTNTVHAMQSGLFWGYVAMVDGLLDRMEKEAKSKLTVLATGGLASLIAPECRRVIDVREDLTLEGLRLAWERAGKKARSPSRSKARAKKS